MESGSNYELFYVLSFSAVISIGRPSAGSFLLRGQHFSKWGTLKGRLKQLHLEKDPDYNIR